MSLEKEDWSKLDLDSRHKGVRDFKDEVEIWKKIVDRKDWGYDTFRGNLYCLLKEKFPEALNKATAESKGYASYCPPQGSLVDLIEFLVDNWSLTAAALCKERNPEAWGCKPIESKKD